MGVGYCSGQESVTHTDTLKGLGEGNGIPLMTGFLEGNFVNETATPQLKSEDTYLIFGVHNRYIVCKYRTRVVYGDSLVQKLKNISLHILIVLL